MVAAPCGLCSVCFSSVVLSTDKSVILCHYGLIVRDNKVVGKGACTGSGRPPYSGPTCPETDALCPHSTDRRRCIHETAVVIETAWTGSATVDSDGSVNRWTPALEDLPAPAGRNIQR